MSFQKDNHDDSLIIVAKKAVESAELEFKDKPQVVDPNTNANTSNLEAISIARHFLSNTLPDYLKSDKAHDQDRLVKIGRSIIDLLSMQHSEEGHCQDEKVDVVVTQQGLCHILQLCDVLTKVSSDPSNNPFKVPRVRFGRTGLQMPMVTLGTMRFQQTWGQNIHDIADINQKGQQNLMEILRYAIFNLGINHIECARSYGSSELQMGEALQQLFQEGGVKREDLIIQTKVNAMKAKDFRETLDKSLNLLQVDYIDLFSIHGLNLQYHYDLVFNNPSAGENLIDIVREYQEKGKIRHVGFSSHGQPGLIMKCIETDQFDYANIHYHAFGSYTASGGGSFGGNEEVVRLLKKKDMGIFIISPYDKGGR